MADRYVLELSTMEVVTTCNGGPLRARAKHDGGGHHWMADSYVLELSTMEVVTTGWLTVTR